MKEYDVRNLKFLINGIEVECFNSIDMEQYIASYKHLIGCEFVYKSLNDVVTEEMIDAIFYLPKFMTVMNKETKFYIDDGTHVNDSATLGTYKEYMQLHYPEYKHIWKHQL